MRKILFSLLALGFAASLSPSPARADGALPTLLTPFDKQRLAKFDATFRAAVAEAKAGGSKEDIAVLDQALSGRALPVSEGYDARGTWKCRTIKLGGDPALTVYGWFTCRITDDGAGWTLEKLTGSQRTKGMFYTNSATQLAYVGAGYVAGEKPRKYGQDPKENQVAIAEQRGRNKLILMFPAPQYESKADILLLER